MTERCGPSELDRCLCWRKGQIHLNIPDGVLPSFLIEAYNCTCTQDHERARALLSEAHLIAVEQFAGQQPDGIAVVFLVLGMVYQRLGLLRTASQWYERTLAVQPHALVYAELASLHQQRFLYAQALDAFEKALALAPDLAHLRERYSDYLVMTGRVQEAVDHLQKRVDNNAIDAPAHSSLLICLHYLAQISPSELGAAHRLWGRKHAPPSPMQAGRDSDLDPDRPLRIGFLSADFRQHSVAYTFEALLDGRDSADMELWGYGSVACPDQVTERLKGKFDRYRSILQFDDKSVAKQVEADRIDILVALAGHTSGHRLGVLAFQPAPVQVDCGSLASLGMEQVKYRLSDQHLDPPDQQENYVEELVYLPGGFVCYRPAEDMPAIGPPPVTRNGYVTFGSFNNLLKINDDTLKLWARVLQAVQASRLLLKFPGSHDPRLADEVRTRLQGHGIDAGRLIIAGYCRSLTDHWQHYHAVDIALDTYPFNGCVTSLEGLWMGVPLISLVGQRYTNRTGLSILTQLELDFFCAGTPAEYVAKARALAGQVPSLVKLRASLRERMEASALCDRQRYARELLAACRSIWQRHCQNGAGLSTNAASMGARLDGEGALCR